MEKVSLNVLNQKLAETPPVTRPPTDVVVQGLDSNSNTILDINNLNVTGFLRVEKCTVYMENNKGNAEVIQTAPDLWDYGAPGSSSYINNTLGSISCDSKTYESNSYACIVKNNILIPNGTNGYDLSGSIHLEHNDLKSENAIVSNNNVSGGSVYLSYKSDFARFCNVSDNTILLI